jgi:dihydroflavonol-4-reductase
MYALWARNPREIYDSNVTGTINILEAAGQAGCRKSSIPAASPPSGYRKMVHRHEEVPLPPEDMVSDYKRSKYLAEQEVLKYASVASPWSL